MRVCVCAAAVNCDREFSSRAAHEGTFSSPGYPSPHPGDITCRYRFHGHGRERVQIIFDDVDLNTPSATMPTKTKSVLPPAPLNPVYTIQPVVSRLHRVNKHPIGCQTGLYNRLDNRLYRVNGALVVISGFKFKLLYIRYCKNRRRQNSSLAPCFLLCLQLYIYVWKRC